MVAGFSGCREASHPVRERGEALPEASAERSRDGASAMEKLGMGPFTRSVEGSGKGGNKVAECTKLVVGPVRGAGSGPDSLEVHATNSCEVPVAVLTGPIVVMTGAEARREPWLGRTDVFARFVVLREGERLTGNAEETPRIRDGQAYVFGAPRYFLVEAQSEASIPVVGAEKMLRLRPGTYCVVILTYGAQAGDAATSQEPFDLTLTIKRHNEEARGERALLSADAWMLPSECKNFSIR